MKIHHTQTQSAVSNRKQSKMCRSSVISAMVQYINSQPSTGEVAVELRIADAEKKLNQLSRKLTNRCNQLQWLVTILNSMVRSRLVYIRVRPGTSTRNNNNNASCRRNRDIIPRQISAMLSPTTMFFEYADLNM